MATKVKSRGQVLEQVRKLLNLADLDKNTSQDEACTALMLAHELLEQHGLDMAEVHVEEETGWDIVDWKDKPRSQYDTWNKHLGFATGDLFNCQYYTQKCGLNASRTYYLVRIGFIGESVDIIMVQEVWPWLTKMAKRLARVYAGKGWNSSHRSFAEAFATRVWMRAQQMNRDDAAKKEAERTATKADGTKQVISTALVVAEKKEAIQQWLEDQGIKFGKARKRSRTGDYDAYAGAAGNDAGRNVNLNFKRQVSKGQDNKQLK